MALCGQTSGFLTSGLFVDIVLIKRRAQERLKMVPAEVRHTRHTTHSNTDTADTQTRVCLGPHGGVLSRRVGESEAGSLRH